MSWFYITRLPFTRSWGNKTEIKNSSKIAVLSKLKDFCIGLLSFTQGVSWAKKKRVYRHFNQVGNFTFVNFFANTFEVVKLF